jgi:hypothetical protein
LNECDHKGVKVRVVEWVFVSSPNRGCAESMARGSAPPSERLDHPAVEAAALLEVTFSPS